MSTVAALALGALGGGFVTGLAGVVLMVSNLR
jgi:hypothetical protein